MNEIREELSLDRINQKVVAIFDIFAVHPTDVLFLNWNVTKSSPFLSQSYLLINCKLGCGRNLRIQGNVKRRFSRVVPPKSWNCLTITTASIDSRTSSFKPLYANWIINTLSPCKNAPIYQECLSEIEKNRWRSKIQMFTFVAYICKKKTWWKYKSGLIFIFKQR